MRWISGLVVVAGGIGLVAWYVGRPPSVAVVSPTRGDAAEIVYASGSVEPRNWAKVAPVVRERIVEQCDCEGQRVSQGDMLARLDDSEARAALSELEARQTLAREELRRLSALAESNAASQQALDRAGSEVTQVEALVAGQRARLETYILRAPSSGVVLRQDGEVGEVAELGTVLFWVGEPTPLIVVAEVNEEDIPRVEAGQPALLRANAFPGRTLDAVVDSITPMGDPVSKTYRVRFSLPDDTPLRIGMSADVNIVIRVAKQALLVPAEVIAEDAVVVVEGGVLRRRAIETGIAGSSGIEVLAGLDDDARIVAPYPTTLDDGARVAVAPAAE